MSLSTVVFSFPGRELTTWNTIAELERQNPGEPFWIYRSPSRPAVPEFWRALGVLAAYGDDVLFLEDDVITARNFIDYARRWPAPEVTSFFRTPRQPEGLADPEGFHFSQAVKFPIAVLRRMFARQRRATWTRSAGHGQDDEIGRCLQALGERVIYHRSLVQHVGAVSASWGPDVPLEQRTAQDFPGYDFDCASVL